MNRNARVSAWRESGIMIGVRGHQIFVRDGGRADQSTLLLVHGFPTSSWDWQAIWPELENDHRLICFDMLGFGFSDKPARHQYSIFEQADIAEDLLQHLGVARYHILAHDYGDTVAQELLARNVDQQEACALASVCLLNGGLFPESHRLLTIQKLLLSPIGPLVARLSSRRSLAASMQHIFGPETQPDDELLDGFWQQINENHGSRSIARLIRYVRERVEFRGRWVGALQHGERPLKFINGSFDPISGAHMAERYRELVADADITELPDIGHYPQIESPVAVANAYAAFRSKFDQSISSRKDHQQE